MKPRLPARQRGASLLLALFIAITLALAFSFRLGGNEAANRQLRTLEVLAQARAALIGAAAAPPNTGGLGLLPLPDLGSVRNSIAEEGRDAGNFTGNAKNLSVIGRLPWRTLGIAPLRDVDGECLWYAVSGSAQTAQAPDTFNWDSIGHFELFASDGTATGTRSLTTDPHTLPLALVIAPGAPLPGQNRTVGTDVTSECGGNYDAANYLDPAAADPRLNNIINYFSNTKNHATGDASASPKPLVTGSVDAVSGNNRTTLANDLVLPITAKDVFDVAKQRSDFQNDLNTLITDLTSYLNTLGVLPTATGSKGFDAVVDKCLFDSACPIKGNATKTALLNQWRDNFLYAGGPTGSYTVGTTIGCKAVLIFAGERTAGQTRATPTQKNTPAMYLENDNAALFPSDGTYTGAIAYNASASSADVVRCITGLSSGATQVSFASDFSRFYTAGGTADGAVTGDSITRTVGFASAPGRIGGCFWSPILIPLQGKTLRAYYEYRFAYADTYTIDGDSNDRGYGATFQLVRGDIPGLLGVPAAPTTCGTETNLGALGTTDPWGNLSYIVETDVFSSSSQNDPAGNHVAIMTNGSLNHTSASGGKPTVACNGSTNACLFLPSNVFEESPSPLRHNQRIEIHTGCNAGCAQCNPRGGGTNARISVWVDCVACADVSADFVNAELIFATTNRDFAAAGDWLGNNWTLDDAGLTHTPGAFAATLPNNALTTPAVAGKTYRVRLTLRTDIPGKVQIGFGGATTAALDQAVGTATYVLDFDATSNGALTVTPDALWAGAIVSASIVPVAPATARRCVALPSAMNNVFFGLTGGFRSGTANTQGVTFGNLYLRSD